MKRAILALMLALCVLCLGGCAQLMDGALSMVADKAEASGADRLARQFIDGVIANDPEACLSAMVSDVTMDSLLAVFPQAREMLAGTESYTLEARSWNTNISNGVKRSTFQFLMTATEQAFVVETLQLSTKEGLYNINITPYTPAPEAAARPADAAAPAANVTNIVLTVVSVAEIVFILWMLLDCCKRRLRRKWLMILVILLGNVLVTFLLTQGKLRLNMNLGLYLSANAFSLLDGGFSFRLLIPVGALYYRIRRHALINDPDTEAFGEAFRDAPDIAPLSLDSDFSELADASAAPEQTEEPEQPDETAPQ